MSTGKRLAKRSILGTRVCALEANGQLYPGVIVAVKTVQKGLFEVCSRYSVRFDRGGIATKEFHDADLIGPGFQCITSFKLRPGQRVFVTHFGREVSGIVLHHRPHIDEVLISLNTNCTLQTTEGAVLEVCKRLEEVRVLESRKSLRLMEQEDSIRPSDISTNTSVDSQRKRPSSLSIDVPYQAGSRKRRPSISDKEDLMDECAAAMVLMSLSCSPHSPHIDHGGSFSLPNTSWASDNSSTSSGASSWQSSRWMGPPPHSASPSPILRVHSPPPTYDEGIVIDDEMDEEVTGPKKKKSSHTVYQCTWPGCSSMTSACFAIEKHVREMHLGPRISESDLSDHEEEFYYTEMDSTDGVESCEQVFGSLALGSPSPPTLSHMDMARPPHEDPDYQRLLHGVSGSYPPLSSPISIQSALAPITISASSPLKLLRLSHNQCPGGVSPTKSPVRKGRGDVKKCRKVYGMEHRDLWCTQCKWKKACSRFGE